VKGVFSISFETNYSIRGVQSYYSDLDMLGRHYLIFNKMEKGKKRQYTICNVMEFDTYKQYLRAIRAFKTAKSPNDPPTF
jgi:hypothetical protein